MASASTSRLPCSWRAAAVAAVVVQLDDLAERALRDQPAQRSVDGIEGQGPVDGQLARATASIIALVAGESFSSSTWTSSGAARSVRRARPSSSRSRPGRPGPRGSARGRCAGATRRSRGRRRRAALSGWVSKTAGGLPSGCSRTTSRSPTCTATGGDSRHALRGSLRAPSSK